MQGLPACSSVHLFACDFMQLVKLIIRNAFRQKLRTALTIFGMAVAILAFCLFDTVVQAWYVGVDTASPNRLISRNSVSMIFPLPLRAIQQ